VVIVFMIDRGKLQHLEPLDAGKIHKILKDAGVEPSSDWGGVIVDDEKVIVVYASPPTPAGKIAGVLGIDASYLVKTREFEDMGKGRYTVHEGINKKGNYEKIEVLRE